MAFFQKKEKSKNTKNIKSTGSSWSSRNSKDKKDQKGKRPPGGFRTARQDKEKGNSASYVLMKLEQCISVAAGASSVKIVADKLFEASKYIAELEEIERKGLYKGKPGAKDYVKSFVQRKDIILMDGIKRAFLAGESKEAMLANDKFLTDEMKAFIQEN